MRLRSWLDAVAKRHAYTRSPRRRRRAPSRSSLSCYIQLSTETLEPRQLLTANGLDLESDAISAETTGSLSGFKWHDANGDGSWDTGEAGLAGWTIYIDANGDAWAGSNYLLIGGSGRGVEYCSRGNDGLFWRGSRTKIRDITDGTSNTVFIAEALFGNRGPDTTTLQDAQRQMKRVSGGPPCVPTGDAMLNMPASRYEGRRAGAWILSTGYHSLVHAYFTPNSEFPDMTHHGEVVSGPRSLHTGGAQVARCDGSVRFGSDNVDLETFRNTFARDDGQVLGEW